MPQPNYRSAQREVKRFRLDRERDCLPVSNQSTGGWNLYVDEVLRKAERSIPAQEEGKDIFKGYAILVGLLLFAVFGTLFVVAITAR